MGSTAQYELGKLNGRYVVYWWEGEKRKRFRLPPGLSAEQARQELTRWVKNRELFLDREDQPTVSEIFALYMKNREIDGKKNDKQDFSWRALKPHFGHLRPDEIGKEACDNYKTARRNLGRKEGTIWTELSVLRAAINWAATGSENKKKFKIIEPPVIQLPPQPPPKERHLTKAEAIIFRNELKMPHLKLFVELALNTAARAGALFELRWTKVDFQRRQIDLRPDGAETNKRRAIVPINDTLLAALEEARRGALTPYVLEWAGTRLRSVKGAFKRAAARCGWDDVTPHVLRHTAAVWMAEAGIPMSEISQYLGHTSIKLTEKIYARYSPDHLRKAARALEAA